MDNLLNNRVTERIMTIYMAQRDSSMAEAATISAKDLDERMGHLAAAIVQVLGHR